MALRESTRLRCSPWWQHLLAGLLYGLLTSAAFPPLGVWPLALAAVVPLCWSACHAGEHRSRAAVMVWFGTLPLWFVQQRWLLNVTQLGYPLLAMYLSLYAAIFVRLLAGTRHRLARAGIPLPFSILAPILWVGVEFVRGEIGLTGYPWFLAGQPLIDAPLLVMPAAIFGAYFISFLVVALTGALADAAGWTGDKRHLGGIGAGAVVLVWLITALIGQTPGDMLNGGRSIRVAIVQTNVAQDNKMRGSLDQRDRDWDAFARLTRAAAKASPKPDLILWPETMFPGGALNPEYRELLAMAVRKKNVDSLQARDDTVIRWIEDLKRIQQIEDLQRECGVSMLVGSKAIDFFRQTDATGQPGGDATVLFYNSAFIIENGSVRPDRYDKIELTPFGEVIPYLWRWKSAQAWVEQAGAGGMKFDLTAGSKVGGLPLSVARGQGDSHAGATPDELSIRLVTPICFEATKPALCRSLVRAAFAKAPNQPVIIVNLSNDGWFGPWTGGREQHLQAARWRCVELGLPMVRAVNTGISCAIDSHGRVTRTTPDGRELDVRTEGVLVYDVPLHTAGRTLYTRIGDAFGWSMLGLTLLVPLGSLLLSRRPRQNRVTAQA